MSRTPISPNEAPEEPRRPINVRDLARAGKIYSLALDRFQGMPLFPGHPPFQVLTYRSPQGIRVSGAQPWGPGNDARLGYMCEYVLSTSHSGAHIDALAHMTIGEDDHWFCGAAATHLGDSGPTVGDATSIPPIWTRGILFDVPRHRGVSSLDRGAFVSADELKAIAKAAKVTLEPGDVALVRTGYLSHWPDPRVMDAHRGAGPDLSAARWFVECGVVAAGSDTETFEAQPARTEDRGAPSNPQPVHTLLLIEKGIYIMESLFLEELARDGIVEFLFVALPLKIRGATGSMIDPIAVI
jgi:kynurenine formamidase